MLVSGTRPKEHRYVPWGDRLSGDINLSFWDSLLYYANAFTGSLRGLVDVTSYSRTTEDPKPAWAAVPFAPLISPFRFWTEWRMPVLLKEHFPTKPFRVLDLGCGDGRYKKFFYTAASRCSYVGLDLNAKSQWNEPHTTSPLQSVEFIADNAEEPSQLEGPFDLWMTSSALEHFSDDGKAVDNISKRLAPGAIGVHAVPAHHSWMIYLKHGFRRYWPARLKSLFSQRGHDVIACEALGGPLEFALHFLFITLPERGLRRERLTHPTAVALYRTLMSWAIGFDRFFPSCFCVGYLVVIKYGKRMEGEQC